MNPFTTVSGPATPLLLDNVDTDTIIRIERLSSASRDQLGTYAMEVLRFHPDGTEVRTCVLNDPRFIGAPILLAGRNFGCGSSREGAVWALAASGVRCVMAESFGDIFFANCFQNGMLPIALPPTDLATVAREAATGAAIMVDLRECHITFAGGGRLSFTVDALKRINLLEGQDDLGLTLRKRNAIAAWQARDRLARPWIWEPVAFD